MPLLSPFVLPSGYSRIQLVGSFEELISTRFANGVNALCWPRELPGDYAEVVRALGTGEGMATLDEDHLRSLPLSDAGRVAVEILLEDQRLLREQGLAPILDCISGYPREEEPCVVRTDVYSFHADSATTEADTWLCTYHGPSSEGLRQEEAVRKVDVPEIRAALLDEFGGEEGAEFEEYLQECCYDLHYAPLPGAVPFVFGLGNLWRIAVQYPDSPVPPCVHRAPENVTGELPRLLLIS